MVLKIVMNARRVAVISKSIPPDTTPQAEVKKYVDEETQNQRIISKEAGQLNGMPAYFIRLPEDQRLVIVKSKSLIFHISYGPNDHKPTDKTLEEIFDRMTSSLKFNK